MKPDTRLKAALAGALATLPFMAHAEANYDGLVTFLIGAVLVVIVLFIVSLVAAIQYYRKGGQFRFYLSLIIAVILYAAFGLFAVTGYIYELSYFVMIPLTPLGILCGRHLRMSSTKLLPYVGMNLVVMQAFTTLVRLLPDMAGGEVAWVVFKVISVLSTALFTWLLMKAMEKSNPGVPDKSYFVNATLLALLSFAIELVSSMISLIRYDGNYLSYMFSTRYFLIGLLPDLVAANLVAWLFIRFYTGRPLEDRAGPPL